MINANRFAVRCWSLFFGCILLFSFCFSVMADSVGEVIDNTEVIEDEVLEVLPVDDVPETDISENDIVEDSSNIDSGTLINSSEFIPDEISAESLTVTANEVVLYSLLPEEDVYPSGAPLEGGVYMHLDTVELGDVLVYVPVDYQYDSFTLNTNGQPINITASQISGYSYDGNDYNIRWSTFGVPTYRPVDYDYGTQYQTLTVNEILGTNIGFWAEGGVSYNYMLMYIMLGGLILIIALKIIGK